MSNPELLIAYDSTIPSNFFDEFYQKNKELGIGTALSARHYGPTGGIEWLLPSAVVVYLLKPFLDAMLKRAADDVADVVYPKIKESVAGLTKKVLISTRDSWKRVGASTGDFPRQGRSPFFSVEAEARDSTKVKFVFNEEGTASEYEHCVEQLFKIVYENYDPFSIDPIENAPTEGGRVYMLYDGKNRRWVATDVHEELHRIAEESIANTPRIRPNSDDGV